MTRWDADELPDLIVGLSDGRVAVHLNIGTLGDPLFAGGQLLFVGFDFLDVGARAAPTYTDFNDDGLRDLVVGAYDGRIHVFLNTGTDTDPVFAGDTPAMEGIRELIVSTNRSSPVVLDFDRDGRLDLVSGDTEVRLAAYLNTGSASAPVFAFHTHVTAGSVAIDLPGEPRSRPSLCDWNADGDFDLLVGSGDGLVRLYAGYPGGVSGLNGSTPVVAGLQPPHPNPFNPTTTLRYVVSVDGPAALRVFDGRGRIVRTLVSGFETRGEHDITWNGHDDLGRTLGSGVYLAVFEAGGVREVHKLTLVK